MQPQNMEITLNEYSLSFDSVDRCRLSLTADNDGRQYRLVCLGLCRQDSQYVAL